MYDGNRVALKGGFCLRVGSYSINLGVMCNPTKNRASSKSHSDNHTFLLIDCCDTGGRTCLPVFHFDTQVD